MKKILVTGATGFIGKALCTVLCAEDYQVHAVHRRSSMSNGCQFHKQILLADINGSTDWQCALASVDVVVHLAARVHVMKELSANPLSEFRATNVFATLNLARQAATLGVKRFIFLSSIKVNGETTLLGKPFTTDDESQPADAYAISKYEAEVGLRQIAMETGMEVVIIRPPLVYGVGVKGNFEKMMAYISKGIYLPFGRINNKRSLVALENLLDVIQLCLVHPKAANQTFLVSDGEDISTTELLQRLALAIAKPTRLIAIPETLLMRILQLLGKPSLSQRLCSNLQVDITKTCEALEWTPRVTVDQALIQTAQHYMAVKHR